MYTTAEEFAAALRELANFAENYPEVGVMLARPNASILGLVTTEENQREALAAVMRAGMECGYDITKGAHGDLFFNVFMDMGTGMQLQFAANRSEVCEKVKVGEKKVTKQRLPEGVSYEEYEETEDIYEWECSPLLKQVEVQA